MAAFGLARGDDTTRPRAERKLGILGGPDRRTVVVTPPGVREVRGDLRAPEDHHRRTAVILLHSGGGVAGSREEDRLHAWQDLYAFAGYLTFTVDYLTSTPKTPAPVYPQPESDAKAAVQYLRMHASEFEIDPESIVVQGFSAGARLGAQLLVAPDDDALARATHWTGQTDRIAGFIGFYGYYNGYQFEPDRYYGGSRTSPDPSVRERWRLADSTARAAGATGPVLLFHGEKDPLPIRQSIAFVDALHAAGKDAELVSVPGATHGFEFEHGKLTPAGRITAQQTLDWLARNFS